MKKPKLTMTDVWMDVGLAVFCLITVILSPLSLFFLATALMKYNLYKKQ